MSIQLSFLKFLNDLLTILSKDTFESRNDRSNLDDLLDKGADCLLDSVVGWLVGNLRLIPISVEHSKHSEDRHDFLGIAVHVLLEINQTVFDCRLQTLLKHFVQFLKVVKPFDLNLLFASEEQFLVNSEQLSPDDFEVLFEGLLLKQQLLLLLSHKLVQFVQLPFLNFS